MGVGVSQAADAAGVDGTDSPDAADAAHGLSRAFVSPARVVVGLLAAAFALGLDVPVTWRYVPLVASVVVLGLPHGAIDHLVPARAGYSPRRSMLAVGGLYAVLGGAYAVGWHLAPAASFVGFIALTWAHWGQGDVHALVAFVGADHLGTRTQRLLAATVRGGLPMLVPLLAFPERYRQVAALLVGRFGTAARQLGPLFAPRTRLALGVGFLALVVGALALGRLRAATERARRDWRRDAGETALLAAFFWTVPPVLAVGVYFCLWHAARHVARLSLWDDRTHGPLARGDLADGLAPVARDAAPLTAGALLALGAAAVLVPVPPTDLPGWVALYLVVIAVLTLPHVAVVAWMDRVEGVWRPEPR